MNPGAGMKCGVGRARIELGIRKPLNFHMPDARNPHFPNVRVGSCVTSIAGPNGGVQLYER